MSDFYKHFRDLPQGIVNLVVPTRIESMMTGVEQVRQDKKGQITLYFVDGTTESAPSIKNIVSDDNFPTFFGIVEEVQGQRKP